MHEAPIAEPRTYAVPEILRDGESVTIRAVRPDDKTRLTDLFQRLSPRSVHLRFFGAKRQLTPKELMRFTELDFVHAAALAAVQRVGDGDRFLAVGQYAEVTDPAAAERRAEVAFMVADEWQGRGIGSLLLTHLARLARTAGIDEFEADVLGENNRMLQVFGESGFVVRRALDSGVVHVRFPTEETDEVITVTTDRERHAAAESVRALLAPRSVALVGASTHPGTIGAALLANLQRAGFQGPIYAIHPTAQEVGGRQAFAHVQDVGQQIDLAVVAVPAPAVEGVVQECARAGVRGLVVISAGFAETGPEGREVEQRLTALVRGSGMRLVGPNCMGVLNTDPTVSLDATFAPHWPPAGNVGMLSQSGALGIAVLDYARSLNIGLSTFVSVGNKADVSGNDLLSYWAEDPRTDVIVLYLESFGNPRKFARLAPGVARRKPIVAVKSGRSAAGTRAASSHSAALATLDVAVDALFSQAGVIRTNTLEELFDVATLLSTQPVPPGRRVGVVTNAGGPGILLADSCAAQGLELPVLAPTTLSMLRTFLPPQAGLANPIDMIASATPQQYARTIAVVGEDPNVDALVVIYVPPMVSAPEDVARAIADAAGTVPRHKPVLTVFLSSKGAPPMLGDGSRGKLPAFSFPENAAMALAAAERYARWRDRPRGAVHTLDRFAESAVRAVVDRVLHGADGPRWLGPTDLATVLRAAGIAMADLREVAPEEAVAAAKRLGFPLVAKAIAPGVLHKSDVGGVILGLESPTAVAAAREQLVARMEKAGTRLEGILLQREVRGGIEALVGVTTDPTFGPLLVCGLGGVLVELLRDVAFRLPPVSDLDATDMLATLRAGRLLDGYRGAPAGDRNALVDVLVRVSALVEVLPELRELDLNPVRVLPPGQGAVAVDGRMRVSPLANA
jgi:acetyl coenzyme A synthetase (ADP forming)-like protein